MEDHFLQLDLCDAPGSVRARLCTRSFRPAPERKQRRHRGHRPGLDWPSRKGPLNLVARRTEGVPRTLRPDRLKLSCRPSWNGDGGANAAWRSFRPPKRTIFISYGENARRIGRTRRLPALSGPLRAERTPQLRAEFPPSPKCRQNVQTGWRRGGDLNPRNPFEFTRSPGVRLKPGSATSPRAGVSMPFVSARLPQAPAGT